MKLLDLTKLNWSTTHNGGTSYGCYYKASTIENGKNTIINVQITMQVKTALVMRVSMK